MKTKPIPKVLALLLMAVMLITVTACEGNESSEQGRTPAQNNGNISNGGDENPANEPPPVVISTDREGNSITLPETMDKIVSIGPSNTEILVALGFGDKIIAADAWSDNVLGITPGVAMLPSFAEIDNEFLIDLQPDVIIVSGMSKIGGNNPLQLVEDTGICVIVIPSSTSIDGIKEDIRFLAAVMGAAARGEEIVAEMERGINEIKAIGAAIAAADRKTVYFEISPAPHMFSFGSGTFLNEMIEIIGAVNILADQDSWTGVSDEIVLDANPDVILTSTNFLDDAIGEIMGRPGWNAITAVQNEAVFYIDADSSNRPSHHIIKALREMAAAVYPELFS